MKKILTICGGFSTEREISIRTGNSVAKGILKAGYESYLMDTAYPEMIYTVTADFFYENTEKVIMTPELIKDFTNKIVEFAPDKVFIGLHGGEGENGQIQAMLELLGIDFVGSGSESSAICMDKNISKIIADATGLEIAKWVMLDEDEKDLNSLKSIVEKYYGYPVVVKASGQGSSVGVEIVHKVDDLSKAVEMMSGIKDEIMVEEYIKGRELSIPVIKGEAFPIIELIPHDGFYDYEHKYTDGATEHVCPAKLPEGITEKISEYAVDIYQAAGCKDYARVDFILTEEGVPYFLELNTLPGMTELSLVPDSARANGIDFPELMKILLDQ